MPATELYAITTNIQQRLIRMPQFWSEIAYHAGLSFATIEGFAKQRPGRSNPRLDTLFHLVVALEIIEHRLTVELPSV